MHGAQEKGDPPCCVGATWTRTPLGLQGCQGWGGQVIGESTRGTMGNGRSKGLEGNSRLGPSNQGCQDHLESPQEEPSGDSGLGAGAGSMRGGTGLLWFQLKMPVCTWFPELAQGWSPGEVG